MQLGRRLIADMQCLQFPCRSFCALKSPGYGLGTTLALLSGVVFASSSVTLSHPHVTRGIATPDGAAVWTLFMGPVRAKRFLVTGEEIGAEQAADLGLITSDALAAGDIAAYDSYSPREYRGDH